MSLELGEQGERTIDVAPAHPQVLGNGQLGEHCPLFGDEAEAVARALVQRGRGRLTIQVHRPRQRGELSAERHQGGRLAGSVGAEQRDDLSCFHVEVEIAHDGRSRVTGVEVACLDERGHWTLPTCTSAASGAVSPRYAATTAGLFLITSGVPS